MSEELQQLLVQVLWAAVLGIIPVLSGWLATKGFLARTSGNLILKVVEHIATQKVTPLKTQNVMNGGLYDLTHEQAQEVMEEAKREVLEGAKVMDIDKPWYKPSLASALSDPKKLELRIERVVQERKRQVAGISRGKVFRR